MTFNQINHLMNILFLCTGNSCRSVLSEGTFNHLAPEGGQAISAGSQPGRTHLDQQPENRKAAPLRQG